MLFVLGTLLFADSMETSFSLQCQGFDRQSSFRFCQANNTDMLNSLAFHLVPFLFAELILMRGMLSYSEVLLILA